MTLIESTSVSPSHLVRMPSGAGPDLGDPSGHLRKESTPGVNKCGAAIGEVTVEQWSPPTGDDSAQMAAGVWWDAVHLPAYLGDRVLALLGEDCGAVVRDPYGHRLYWLIPCGSAVNWAFPEIACVQVLGTANWIIVPPADRVRSAAPYWVRTVEAGQLLTCPDLLHWTIQKVVADALGPREADQPATADSQRPSWEGLG